MVKIMLDTIFFFSNDAVAALQFALDEFSINGLAEEDGKNVSGVLHWILGGSVLLE